MSYEANCPCKQSFHDINDNHVKDIDGEVETCAGVHNRGIKSKFNRKRYKCYYFMKTRRKIKIQILFETVLHALSQKGKRV